MGYAEEAFLSPDQLPGDTFADQATEVSEYAQEAMNRVAAQYRFAGLVAGIKGPNDTDEDVDKAREAILAALSDFLNPETGPLNQEIDRLHRELRAEQDALRTDMMNDTSVEPYSLRLVDDIFPLGHPNDQGSGTMDHMGQGGRDAVFDDAMHRHGLGAALRQRLAAARDKANLIAQLETQRRAQIAAEWRAFWSGVWNKAKDYYNDKMALVAEGKYLVAAGKIVVDGVEIFHVEIVVAIITAAVIAATGGVTVAMAPIIASAVAAAIRVVKVGAGVLRRSAEEMKHAAAAARFSIELRRVDASELNMPVARPESFYSREVDVSRDLTNDEKRLLNEENQGSTEPTDDAGDPGAVQATRLRRRDQEYDRIMARVSDRDVRMAAMAGNSPAQRRARTNLRDAYEAEYGAQSAIHTGMTTDLPMEIVKFPPPHLLGNWRDERNVLPDGTQTRHFGAFYDPSGGAVTPSQLGINSVGKRLGIIDVSDKPGLAFQGRGTPGFGDNFSVDGVTRSTEGGVRQWHVPRSFRPEPSDLVENRQSWRDLPGNKHWVEAEEAGRLVAEDGTGGRDFGWYIEGDVPEAEGRR